MLSMGACSLHKKPEPSTTIVTAPPIDLPPDPMPRVEPRSKYGNPASYVVFGKRYYTLPSSHGFNERGIASWYGKKFHGRRTSSGETYDMYAMTAAHKELPLPTYVEVTNLKNGKRIIVRVNDRGPFHDNRIIDLSYSAARKLDIVREGTGLVEVRALNPMNYRTVNASDSSATQVAVADMEEIPGDENSVELIDIPITEPPQVFIQVGAFSNRENANQLKNQLNQLELGEVTISSVTLNEKQLHRVRIGPMETVESADAMVVKLIDMGMQEHRVVIE